MVNSSFRTVLTVVLPPGLIGRTRFESGNFGVLCGQLTRACRPISPFSSLRPPGVGGSAVVGHARTLPQFVMNNEGNAGTHLWAASATASGSLRIRNTVMNYTVGDDVVVRLGNSAL